MPFKKPKPTLEQKIIKAAAQAWGDIEFLIALLPKELLDVAEPQMIRNVELCKLLDKHDRAAGV